MRMNYASDNHSAPPRNLTFIPLLILERAGFQDGGGGAAGGRAATPFAAERDGLPLRKILEQFFGCFKGLYCDSKLLSLLNPAGESRTLDLTILAGGAGALSGRSGRLKRKNALGRMARVTHNGI
jgi:hypothetical protein